MASSYIVIKKSKTASTKIDLFLFRLVVNHDDSRNKFPDEIFERTRSDPPSPDLSSAFSLLARIRIISNLIDSRYRVIYLHGTRE